MIFLHANGFNARAYRSILLPLADRLRILAVDQRGHGLSSLAAEVSDDRADWYAFRDDLLALLEGLDQEPVVLGGHSIGGAASLMAAAEAPHRVKRLALFDPVMLPPQAQSSPNAGEIRKSPLVQGALRRRAVFDSHQAVEDSYRGRGIFKSWSDEALHDYVGDGFKTHGGGRRDLTCTPAWEASNFISQRHDTWSCFTRSQCPIRIVRAETGSTCRVDGHMEVADGLGPHPHRNHPGHHPLPADGTAGPGERTPDRGGEALKGQRGLKRQTGRHAFQASARAPLR